MSQPPPYPPHPGPPHPGYGPLPMNPAEERQWAMFAHLSGLILGFVGPLIIWLVYKDRGPFVRRQSAEALNFQLFFLIVWMVSIAIAIVAAVLTFGVGLLAIVPLLVVEWVLLIVFMIMAAVAANRGEDYRYPLSIRFVS